jgi:hypothetical protein
MPILQQLDPASPLVQGIQGPAYITSLDDVEASVLMPPCECPDCQHGFYTAEEQIRPCFWYRGTVPDRAAKRIAAEHIQDAQRDRQYLLHRLSSHGGIIINRWKKKSREKRKALLAEAVPELCQQRWLNPCYCYMPESKTGFLGGRDAVRRKQLLAHWLSVEALTLNPAVFFAVLHNRTAYAPQEWASWDTRQLILGWACGHFDVEFSPKCVIMYGPRYGEVVDWEAGPAHRSDILGFPKARLVLEGQAHVMRMIRQIVDRVLQGVDLETPATSEKWKQMTKLGFRHANQLELWSPYTNQAFSAPPVFSADSLISVAQTRVQAMGDHLWLLQTEPSYMRQHLKALYQGEFFRAMKKSAAGALVTIQIFNDVMSYWKWSWIKDECVYVKSVHDRFRDSILPGHPLPVEYNRALGALELLLVNEVNRRADQFGELMPQRPGFSHKWTFQWRPADGPTVFKLERRHGAPVEQKLLFDTDPLEWCLSQMRARPDTQTNYDHAILFSFLETHLAISNHKERSRVDEILYWQLSDLAACHEMLVSVRLHRPQNEARDIEEVKTSEKHRLAWKGWNVPGYLTNEDTISLGTGLLTEFYDTQPRKNSTLLQWSQQTRKALEDFWTGLRKTPRVALAQSEFSKGEVDACLEIISSNLKPDYLASVHAEEEQLRASIDTSRVHKSISVSEETRWASSIESTQLSPTRYPPPKLKNKTRPSEQSSSTETIEEATAAANALSIQDPPPPKFRVKRRAYEMLKLMFPVTAEEKAKGVEWDLFVLAMSDLGLSARNGGGSAVLFENEGLGEAEGGTSGGKIIFHKPHPGSKINPVMLHAFGKRLGKWFGWERERFETEA